MGKNVHVTYRKEEHEWAVKTEKSSRAAGLYDTKEEALAAGREIAQNQKSELVIHRRDGTIQDKDSFGNDPNPPKDTVN